MLNNNSTTPVTQWKNAFSLEKRRKVFFRIVELVTGQPFDSTLSGSASYRSVLHQVSNLWKESSSLEDFITQISKWIVSQNVELNESDILKELLEIIAPTVDFNVDFLLESILDPINALDSPTIDLESFKDESTTKQEKEVDEILEYYASLVHTRIMSDSSFCKPSNSSNTSNSSHTISMSSSGNTNIVRNTNNTSNNAGRRNANAPRVVNRDRQFVRNDFISNIEEFYSIYLHDYKTLKAHQFNPDFQNMDSNCVWIGKTKKIEKFMTHGKGIPFLNIEKIDFDQVNGNFKKLFIKSNGCLMDLINFNFHKLILKAIFGSAQPMDQTLVHFSQRDMEIISIPEIFETIVSYIDLYHRRNLLLVNREYYSIMTQSREGRKPYFIIPKLAVVIVKYRMGDEEMNLINVEEQLLDETLGPKRKKRKF